ncbi:hypothetical protein BGY98DRAFT_1101913 [Russula aff. rugulosa BPL654]|nr:hypothetical protein BGY98DRAFT_1101913 [Russula aff. rugulosa BPL654]
MLSITDDWRKPFRAVVTHAGYGVFTIWPDEPTPPVPMVPNPFSAQNGLLGTNPFPTSPTTHPTNPFPDAGQTMNPFPTAANPNPFTVPTNNSAPNETFLPAPTALELHQTGSHNLSWMLNRDAPLPPPVPRAPTFFKFAVARLSPNRTGLGGSFGLSVQLTSSPPATTLGVGSSIGVGLGPQATASVSVSAQRTRSARKGKQVTLAQEELVQNRSKAQIEAEINELGELKQNLALKVGELKSAPNDERDGGLSAPELAQRRLTVN